MERLGFFVCSADLEDELIRALGAASVERSLPLRATWDRFAPCRGSPSGVIERTEEQLRRFLGSGSGRKIRYARLLVEALDLSQVPRPLDGALAHV